MISPIVPESKYGLLALIRSTLLVTAFSFCSQTLVLAVPAKHTDIEELENARQAAHKGQYVECYNGICIVAGHGHPQAEGVLGHMYEEGVGVRKNAGKAMQCYEKAALKGIPDAECRLGHMYYRGANGRRDPQKAFKWLTLAAKHGMAEAQNTLGHMYLTGDGVRKDIQLASNWLHKAAANGVKEAAQAIISLPPVQPFTKETGAGLAYDQSMQNIEQAWQGYGDIVQALKQAEQIQPQ